MRLPTNHRYVALTFVLSCSCGARDVAPPVEVRQMAIELPAVGECDVLTADIRLRSQLAVDALGARGCTTIVGDLLIEEASDLTPLSALESVQGDFYLRAITATSLAGLQNLRTVTEQLVVEDNAELLDAALPALQTVGSVIVRGNPTLRSLRADAVPAMSGGVELRANPGLSDVSFAALANVSGGVSIVTSSLTNVGGFAALQTATDLVVSNNTLLTDLTGFGALRALSGSLVVRQNDRLTSLGGFNALVTVTDRVAITANALLQDVNLSALSSSTEFLLHANGVIGGVALLSATYEAGWVSVAGNPLLTDLSGLPINATSDVEVRDNDGLTSLTDLGPITLGDLHISQNGALRVTPVPIVGADTISFSRNGSTSLTFAALVGSTRIDIDNNDSLISVSAPLLAQTNLDVFDNAALASLDFPVTTSVLDLDVTDCPVTLVGFPSLTQVTDDLRLIRTNVTNLGGLGPVVSIADDFELIGNSALVTVSELSVLDSVGGAFVITGNGSLPDCEATDLAAQVSSIGGVTTISNNAGPAGCP